MLKKIFVDIKGKYGLCELDQLCFTFLVSVLGCLLK